MFGRSTVLPLSYVENCSDAFVEATMQEKARGETFNVVDDEQVTAWRYTQEYLRHAGDRDRTLMVPVPYPLALTVSRAGAAVGRRLFSDGGDLPDLFVPCRMEAQFKPLQFPNDKLRDTLGWRPRWSFAEGLRRSQGT